MDEFDHFKVLQLSDCEEKITAKPAVPWAQMELQIVLNKINMAGKTGEYIPAVATEENPSLGLDYLFDEADERAILQLLSEENFVDKILDCESTKEEKEYYYVFGIYVRLIHRRQDSDELYQNILIYIKIKIYYQDGKYIVVKSFHKNRPK